MMSKPGVSNKSSFQNTINHTIKGLVVVFAGFFFSTANAALSVNNLVVTSYNDPNNYLGLAGQVSIGDSASATANVTGAPFQLYNQGFAAEYVFSGSMSFTINGLAIPTPNPVSPFNPALGDYTARIFNNATFNTGPNGVINLADDDFYVYNAYFASPVAGFTSLIWAIGALDNTGTALNDVNFFELSDGNLFGEVGISAFLWNANTQTAQNLLLAEVAAVPLPGAAVLFLSSFAGLVASRRLKK